MRNAHFIGIGGIGMSGMARIFKEQGCHVSGSDQNLSTSVCQQLQLLGVQMYEGHKASNISGQIDLVIYSAAITEENPEFREVKKRKIPAFRYSEMLGKLMSAKEGIAVCGTHGKTTTTALMVSVLKAAGKEPGHLIGGEIEGGNGSWGKGKHFVAEACEYARSFHDLFPRHAIITNIDRDHLDYYKDLGEIQDSFQKFIRSIPQGGVVAYSAECKNTAPILKGMGIRAISYGIGGNSGADVYAEEIRYLKGGTEFMIYSKGQPQGRVITRLLGKHNVKNALAVFSIANALRIPFDAIEKGLGAFRGVARRFQELGEGTGLTIIDDYAHHPAKIEAVLSAVKQRYPEKKLHVVFQPHQYSRTHKLLGQFAVALAGVDRLILPEIYGARDSDEEKSKVNSYLLCQQINLLGGNARFIPNFTEIVNHLQHTARRGDVVLIIGAGDVTKVAYMLLDRINPVQTKSA